MKRVVCLEGERGRQVSEGGHAVKESHLHYGGKQRVVRKYLWCMLWNTFGTQFSFLIISWLSYYWNTLYSTSLHCFTVGKGSQLYISLFLDFSPVEKLDATRALENHRTEDSAGWSNSTCTVLYVRDHSPRAVLCLSLFKGEYHHFASWLWWSAA